MLYEVITPSTFYRWKKILDEKEPPGGFIPLLLGTNRSHNRCTDQVPVLDDNKSIHNNSMEFTFPNGVKLHFKGKFDASLLKSIIHLY